MKVLILQSESMSPTIKTSDLVKRYEVLHKYPNIEYTVLIKDAFMTFNDYDKILDDYDALIGMWITSDVLVEDLFISHPRLKYIATTSHGFEEFDKEMTKRYGVTITNTIYGNTTIAQYAMALLMEICHHVELQSQYIKSTYFQNENNPFMKALYRHIEITDKTVGIIGLGSIGYNFAKIVNGFGCKIIGYDLIRKEGDKYNFIEQLSLDEVLSNSDIISLHCPLTKETQEIINKENINKMKEGVILINTARGKLIDEDALLDALNSGKIYSAGLDVLVDENPKQPTLLIKHPNVIVTGHVAWLADEARYRTIDLACENFINYIEGHPTSVVNK